MEASVVILVSAPTLRTVESSVFMPSNLSGTVSTLGSRTKPLARQWRLLWSFYLPIQSCFRILSLLLDDWNLLNRQTSYA